MSNETPTPDPVFKHYAVAWGSGTREQSIRMPLKDAKRAVKQYDRECPKDAPHRVVAVYWHEVSK